MPNKCALLEVDTEQNIKFKDDDRADQMENASALSSNERKAIA